MLKKLKNLMILFSISLMIGVGSASIAKVQNGQNSGQKLSLMAAMVEDSHSYSNPQTIRVTNVDLDWNVLFDKKILQGTAILSFERTSKEKNAPLILDTRDLK
ncbi:MAG: hypothetical protein M3388_07810, partial [Acidobacteriota bacterium]|nr:hypothetical protein [Acidobacteriota bacterium]